MVICRKCYRPLSELADTGRPPAYCSVGCRRAAERELKRLDAQMAEAERMIGVYRRTLEGVGSGTGQPGRPRQHFDWWSGELSRLEARMRELLETAPKTPETAQETL